MFRVLADRPFENRLRFQVLVVCWRADKDADRIDHKLHLASASSIVTFGYFVSLEIGEQLTTSTPSAAIRGGDAVESLLPALHVICSRIRHRHLMLFVPMAAMVEAAIDPDEHDPGRAELNCQIERLKARVAASADIAWPLDQNIIAADLLDHDPVQRRIRSMRADRGKAAARRNPSRPCSPPPSVIARIEDVRPWREAATFVYDDDMNAPAQKLDRRLLRRRPGADDRDAFAAPILPPWHGCWPKLRCLVHAARRHGPGLRPYATARPAAAYFRRRLFIFTNAIRSVRMNCDPVSPAAVPTPRAVLIAVAVDRPVAAAMPTATAFPSPAWKLMTACPEPATVPTPCAVPAAPLIAMPVAVAVPTAWAVPLPIPACDVARALPTPCAVPADAANELPRPIPSRRPAPYQRPALGQCRRL